MKDLIMNKIKEVQKKGNHSKRRLKRSLYAQIFVFVNMFFILCMTYFGIWNSGHLWKISMGLEILALVSSGVVIFSTVLALKKEK